MNQMPNIFKHWDTDKITEIDGMWPIDTLGDLILIVIDSLEENTPLTLESMTEEMLLNYLYNKLYSGLIEYHHVRRNILNQQVSPKEIYMQTMIAGFDSLSYLKDILVEIPSYLFDRERILEGGRFSEFEDEDEVIYVEGASEIFDGYMGELGSQYNISSSHFYKEFYERVEKTTQDCEKLIPLISEFISTYKQKEMKKDGKLSYISHEMTMTLKILDYIQDTGLPFGDDEELNDSIKFLKNLSRELSTRLVSAKVIIKDIIEMNKDMDRQFIRVHLYLSMLKSMLISIEKTHDELRTTLINFMDVYPELSNPDNLFEENYEEDDDDQDEVYKPDDFESYQKMKGYLMDALGVSSRYGSKRFGDFVHDVFVYLTDFGQGKTPEKEFEFGMSLQHGYNIDYIDLNLESEIIEITHGGSTVFEEGGSDSYTDWMYSISIDSWEENEEIINFKEILDLVVTGAKIEIYRPEEYDDIEY